MPDPAAKPFYKPTSTATVFTGRPDPDAVFIAEAQRSEAISEKKGSLVLLCVILGTYVILLFAIPGFPRDLLVNITALVMVATLFLGAEIGALHWGWYKPWIRYGNVFFQASFVSAIIYADAASEGPLYALSSMPPLAYALVICLSAFRLEPTLAFFTGACVALQFTLLYFFYLYPHLGPDTIRQIPSVGIGVTLMKVIILLGIGASAGIAAKGLNKAVKQKVEETKRRERLKYVFGRYVSPQIAEQVTQSNALAKPTLTTAVLMFGDLRNFTSFSSGRPPEEVAEFLNNYFDVTSRIIEGERGFINKFLGDGFLALFGVPVAQEDMAEAAVRAAERLLKELTPLLEPRGLDIGLALHYGPVIAGEIGSTGRCEFTVIGEHVNLAARLESLNRPFGTRCLVSKALASHLPPGFALKPRGAHRLRGLTEPLEIFELIP